LRQKAAPTAEESTPLDTDHPIVVDNLPQSTKGIGATFHFIDPPGQLGIELFAECADFFLLLAPFGFGLTQGNDD